MQTTYLRYFLSIVETGSIAGAAKRHFISPQGLSRSLAALETELGFKLCTRNKNSLTLTLMGHNLVSLAAELIEAEDRLLHESVSSAFSGDATTRRYIGLCCEGAFSTGLLDPISSLDKRVLDSLVLVGKSNSGVLDDIDNSIKHNTTDCFFGIICIEHNAQQRKKSYIRHAKDIGYKYYPLLNYFEMIAVSLDSPLASRDCLSFDDVADSKLVIPPGYLDDICLETKVPENICAISGSVDFSMRLVNDGVAITYVPSFKCASQTKGNIAFLPLSPTTSVEAGLIAKEEDLQDVGLLTIINHILSSYSDLSGKGLVEIIADPKLLSCSFECG